MTLLDGDNGHSGESGTPERERAPYVPPPPGHAATPVYSEEELRAMAQAEAARAQAAVDTARRLPEERRTKNPMRARWQLMNRFVDEGMAGLEASDTKVWFGLYRHARADGLAKVSRERLEAATGLSSRTVKVAIQRLIASGWLARVKRGGPNGGIAVYRVQAPKVGCNGCA